MQGLIKFYFNILLFNCSYLLIAQNKPSCILVYFYCSFVKLCIQVYYDVFIIVYAWL